MQVRSQHRNPPTGQHHQQHHARRSVDRCFKAVVVVTVVIFVAVSTGFQSGLAVEHRHTKQSIKKNNKNKANNHHPRSPSTTTAVKKPLRLAFIGNSILYYNDCPGLLAKMLESTGLYTVSYNSCLEGGATLLSLLEGCNPSFTTNDNHGGTLTMAKLLGQPLDFAIINDQTQSPALSWTRSRTLRILKQSYAPQFYRAGATPVFVQTAAYRTDVPEIGTFDEFTAKVQQGYQEYASRLTDYFASTTRQHEQQLQLQKDSAFAAIQKQRKQTWQPPKIAKVAPVGWAYADLHHNNPPLWEQLYIEDGVHPSALGTWLQACVLYATMLGKEPPMYQEDFWRNSRGRLRTHLELPTQEQAKQAWVVALRFTGIMDDESYVDH